MNPTPQLSTDMRATRTTVVRRAASAAHAVIVLSAAGYVVWVLLVRTPSSRRARSRRSRLVFPLLGPDAAVLVAPTRPAPPLAI